MFFRDRHRLGRATGRAGLGALIAGLVLLAGVVGASGAEPACTTERFPALARGYNLTGWFDDIPPRPPKQASLVKLRHLGMRHVRLPITADTVIPAFAGAEAVKARVAEIDAAVALLLKLDYAVIIDLHTGSKLSALFGEDRSLAKTRVGEAWQGLAALFKPARRGRLFAELLNEPPLEDADWAAAQAELLPMLRRLLPDTPLILSTGGPQLIPNLTATTPAADPNILYAVHFYDPFPFTHQGADWIEDRGIAALRDVPFPMVPGSPRLKLVAAELRLDGQEAMAEKIASLSFGEADIEGSMQSLADWSRRTRVAVTVDEFGVYSGRALKPDRIHWLETVVKAAQSRCLAWTHWEFRDGFGFVDGASGKPDPELTAALLGKSPK